MAETITYTDTLSVLECGSCHISFAIPRDMLKSRQADGLFFWCPNGDKIHYFETETEKLRKKLEREERWRKDAETRARAAEDQADAAERSASAYKGVATKLKKRASAGVCPCCHRSFQALREHMASQHPGFAAEDGQEGVTGTLAPEPESGVHRGVCGHCGAERALNGDGSVRKHGERPGSSKPCKGSWMAPARA